MSACAELAANASAGVAPALRAVDCLANETTAAAFGRLFGGADGAGGALLPALTILLTLYIAFFAVSLLTGRSRIGISALTPRMMTLGLVLTFATSWVAYQSVVWNLAIGGPDQIAGVLLGARGSATQLFADRIDIVFAAIAEVSGQGGGEGATQAAASGSFTPGNLMWLGALLLLLGTVGVLVTARIALAVLLAIGPVFVVFGLFSGTRGLTAGWLRGLVLTAITPLFVVVGGGLILELLVPVVAALRNGEGGVDGRAALGLFLVASVHVALMGMVLKVAGSMVSGWRVFGLAGESGAGNDGAGSGSGLAVAGAPVAQDQVQPLARSAQRPAAIVSGLAPAMAEASGTTSPSAGQSRVERTTITQLAAGQPVSATLPRQRARGIGSRFVQSPRTAREMIR